ncbi:GDP-L-fucose synthase family protein [Luteibacter sp. RCC_6_2]|uniref:GDP-L-fucose synthase family protein n=1 Tax=Luteibacter sp. RCC_6_2 TaxID=3239223 RepID=UPI003523F82F
MMPLDLEAPIYVAGHRGLAGSAIVRRLQREGATRILTRDRKELDLRNQEATNAFFKTERPAYVFLAAAKVGGIYANSSYPADFIGDNLAIQTNVIHSAWQHGARKLLFLGSSCIYPRDCPQPIKEDYLLTGPLEATNEAYAIAKIAGLAMCQAYRRQHGFDAISAMPTNLYGPNDNFHPENSHVLPALIRRFVGAADHKTDNVTVWGSGKPLREFMHSDDMADAALFLMNNYSDVAPMNIGSNDEVSIASLAQIVASTAGFRGDIIWDASKPDGTPRKRLDSTRLLDLGWRPSIPLKEGIDEVVAWFRQHYP